MFSSPSKNSLNNRRLPISVLFHHPTSVLNHSHSTSTTSNNNNNNNNSSCSSPTSLYPTSPSSLLITSSPSSINNSHHPRSPSFTLCPTLPQNSSSSNQSLPTTNNNNNHHHHHHGKRSSILSVSSSSPSTEKSNEEISVSTTSSSFHGNSKHTREKTTVVVMDSVDDHAASSDPLVPSNGSISDPASHSERHDRKGRSLSKITKDLKDKQQQQLSHSTNHDSLGNLDENGSVLSKTMANHSPTVSTTHSELLNSTQNHHQEQQQQLLSTTMTTEDSSELQHPENSHEKPSLKRRMSSFLFRKSLTHEPSEVTKSFKLSTNAARKSLTGAVTASSPQLNGENAHMPKQTSSSISKSSRQSWSKSFFSSKNKVKENVHLMSNVASAQQQGLKNSTHHPSPQPQHSRFSSGSSNSSAALTIVHSNGFGLSESPDTSSSSFDFATLDASVDNVSTGGDLTYIEPTSSNNFSKKNILTEEFANVQHQFGSIESLRATFLQFISNQTGLNSSTSKTYSNTPVRILENELLIELYFMDFMYGNSSGKLSRKLTNSSSILSHLDSFCKFLLSKFDRQSQLWRDIIEDQASHLKYPFLECMVVEAIDNEDESQPWMTHQRLGQFLKHSHEYYVKSVSDLPEDFQAGQLKKQIQMLCDMFYVELDDYFMIFQSKNYKYMKQWISEGLKHKVLPNHVIELYRKDKEYHDKMQSDFKITPEDFTVDHVIDRDWKFMKYFCNDFSSHWFLTFSQIGKVTYWNSFSDFSTDNLSLRMSKVVGYFDYPIEHVAKALANDDHLQYQFKNMKWSSYSSINESNSLHKYPSVLMSGSFDSGSLFLSRSIQLVFSTKCNFCEDELVEVQTFFKTCDVMKEKSKKDLIKIKMPLLGMRILTKLDNHRTRFVEVRFSNLGGLLNSKIVLFNPLTSKKTCLETYQGLLDAIKRSEQQGFPLPSSETNNLMRLWKEYCKHYFNMDIGEKYK